jgi:hypothetical protein
MVFITSSAMRFLSPDIIPYDDGRILFQSIMPRGCVGPTNFKADIVAGDNNTPVGTLLRLLKKVPNVVTTSFSSAYRGNQPTVTG